MFRVRFGYICIIFCSLKFASIFYITMLRKINKIKFSHLYIYYIYEQCESISAKVVMCVRSIVYLKIKAIAIIVVNILLLNLCDKLDG